ncbi:hypothetical protein KIN20_004555 [Parelaphostrongylus tenuis]|uniref:Afadin n=1 Tax=Parelaphostrongylus tenuis TaxID=148309 RepID=A0AAD5QJF1_PARTN|nr:hypothetical protein KIN20_004555 [Parelaphostrongylus tenuis]
MTVLRACYFNPSPQWSTHELRQLGEVVDGTNPVLLRGDRSVVNFPRCKAAAVSSSYRTCSVPFVADMMVPPSEREQLASLVEQWNENRLDLFHLTYPTEDLEIEGVMRFYFQDGGERVLTKCVRVSSTATTRAVVDALTEKFLPDLKMLSDDTYTLWELHESGGERKLDDDEKPLLVQLTWHRDDREGRFLLRKSRQTSVPLATIQLPHEDNMKRATKRFSKREKKELKKKHQKDIITVNSGREEALAPATDLYCQVPPNSFTRTISNPEVVMKKRREKKLEARLKEMGHGGSLKIYGGELVPSRPYVTILVSMQDRAEKILLEALEKYGFDPSSASEYALAEIATSEQVSQSLSDLRNISAEGRIISPDEIPLMQMTARSTDVPETYLALKRKPKHYRDSRVSSQNSTSGALESTDTFALPAKGSYLQYLNQDGSTLLPHKFLTLCSGVTEIGSDRVLMQFSAQNICLSDPEIRGRHCVVTYMDGIVTITPSASDAIIEINNRRIGQTEILRDGDFLRIGRTNLFRFVSHQKLRDADELRHSDYSTLSHAMNHVSLSPTSTPRNQASQIGTTLSSQTVAAPDQNFNGLEPVHSSFGTNLPISLQIGDYKVWDYLAEVMSRGWTDAGVFRLSPAYSLYLALRFFQSHSKAYLVQFFTRIAHHLNQISQECTSRDELLFWLANASELSFLVDRDKDLRSPRAGQLITAMENIFRRLCTVLVGALKPTCKRMLDVTIPVEDGSNELLSLLDGTLRAARASRLNAALTIQLCSHVLHAVNATLFNALVGVSSSPAHLTTRLGRCLWARLASIHSWAEQMGVELAAECHLDRSRQAAALLAAQKNDVAALGATCYKLNSLQVRFLLTHFSADDGEIPCDDDVINRVVSLAERQADHLTLQDGHPITLAETEQLLLPFLFPQDGYTAEQLRGVSGWSCAVSVVVARKGLCHSVSIQESDDTAWQASQSARSTAVTLRPPPPQASCSSPQVPLRTTVARSSSQSTLGSLPTTHFGDSLTSIGEEIMHVVLKRNGGGIGLSIVAAQGVGDRQVGIYVKKVVAGSPAALDGRLAAGDQLLSVNGQSLLGISQEEAAEYMARAGAEVRFDVRKGAALRNGLDAWLCQPVQSTTHQLSHPFHQSSSNHTQNNNNSYSYYAPLQECSSQISVQTANSYQKHQPGPRTSAFAPVPAVGSEANQHMRSVSASDLYQNDPNASFSQRSLAGSTTGATGFDPTTFPLSPFPPANGDTTRPSATSPSALRRGAQSPASIHRPPSATNLFAPPRSPNPLQQQGYSSASVRDVNHDLYRASLPSSPPAAHSSPREEHRVVVPSSSLHHPALSYSSLPPTPQNRSDVPNSNHHHLLAARDTTSVPYLSRSPTSPKSQTTLTNGNTSYARPPTYSSPADARPQEMVVIRPTELSIQRDGIRIREEPRSTTTFGVMAPTAFTQALQAGGAQEARVVLAPPRTTGFDRELRNLEKTNTALMSHDAVNEELDRLDAKGINMTEEETRRYRELLNVASEQSRTREQKMAAVVAPTRLTPTDTRKVNRTETVIDDIDESSGRSTTRENISSGDVYERKSFQNRETVSLKETEILDSPSIYGTNEIYRDPRQQRLNELQERQETQSQVPDGMGFRDKMRMFATQLGEGTPKTRYSASSAERQIRTDQY